MLVSNEDYSEFQLLLQKNSGILLGDNKQYLVASRLGSFLKEQNLNSFSELLGELKKPMASRLAQEVIDRMTTNETLWFRDSFPFDFLISHILPEIKQRHSRSAKIWCAACSSGQEPYSISMAVEEAKQRGANKIPSQVDILSTDISSRILEQARKAEYQSIEISRGLSQERQDKHFDKTPYNSFVLKSNLKSRIRFSALNLMELPYRQHGKFDVIFCRNVLIYFSAELKQSVISGLAGALNPGGYLFLGASESMPPRIKQFEMVRCNPGLVYRKISD